MRLPWLPCGIGDTEINGKDPFDSLSKGAGIQKRLTITIDEDVYSGLSQVVGKRKISRFIESLVRPYVIYGDIREGYRQMAADTEREAEADGVAGGHR